MEGATPSAPSIGRLRRLDRTQLSSLAVCRSLSGSKSRSRPGGEARSISRAAGTSAAELLLAVQPAAGCCARETVLTMAQPVRTRCQTSSRWRQAHARRHGGINRCARCGGASCGAAHGQPVPTSPACPPDTVLPRPCCRAAWNFVSDYREQKRLTFRRRDADRCAGLPCRYGWGNATVHRGMRDAAEIPPDRTFRSPPPSRRQSSRLGHPLRMILFCFRCPRVTSGRVSVGRAFRGSASVDGSSVNI